MIGSFHRLRVLLLAKKLSWCQFNNTQLETEPIKVNDRIKSFFEMITYFVMAFPFLLQLFNKIVNSFIHCHNRLLHSLMGDLCLALTRWLLCTKRRKGSVLRIFRIQGFNARRAYSLLPLCRTNIRQFSVFHQGPKLFNYLPTHITSSPSLASFRKKLKKSILDKC